MFFKVIPDVLGRLVNFNIRSRFLLGQHVFPDYFSVSCDYDETFSMMEQSEAIVVPKDKLAQK